MQNMQQPDQPIFKVSEFNEMVNYHLARLGEVVIEGEISELNVSQNKWLFITLKEGSSNVSIFGVLYNLDGWKQLEEGMLVHVYGTPRVHMKSGRFSVTAEKITPAGEGSLKIAFEKLKKQLEMEGLFDESRKRALPEFPQKVGLITAKGSQAYNDFVKVLQERMGGLHILFFPVTVQGETSVEKITQAIAYFNKHESDLDALVVCRGGGSLEDLHAFNDERVVRAIFASSLPVVCGVGHEGDISLADLVADVRASTPSNAAELLVKERTAQLDKVHMYAKRMHHILQLSVHESLYHVSQQNALLERSMNRITERINKLIQSFGTYITSYKQKAQSHHSTAIALERLLLSMDHKNVLKRGYSITRSRNGAILTSVSGVQSGTHIETEVYDGTIYSDITKTKKQTSTST